MNNYWVGKLSDGRLVLFDPDVQGSSEETVRLFVYDQKTMQDFPRVATRQSIKPFNHSPESQEVIDCYWLNFKVDNGEQVSTRNQVPIHMKPDVVNSHADARDFEGSVVEPENIEGTNSLGSAKPQVIRQNTEIDDENKIDPRFSDLHEEMINDMSRSGSGSYQKDSYYYDYSTDDQEALDSDDFLDDY